MGYLGRANDHEDNDDGQRLGLVGVDFDRHRSLLLHCGTHRFCVRPLLSEGRKRAVRTRGGSSAGDRVKITFVSFCTAVCVFGRRFSNGYHNSWLTLADKRPLRPVIQIRKAMRSFTDSWAA